MPKADFLVSILFVFFGIVVLLLSLDMPRFEDKDVNPYSVPGIVPGFLGAIIAFLGLVMFLRSMVRKGYQLGITGDSVQAFFTAETTKRFAMTIIICVVYAILILGTMPYEIANFIFVFFFVAFFEFERGVPLKDQKKKLLIAVLVAAITALSVGYVFRSLFLVNLPGGGLVSAAAQVALYG